MEKISYLACVKLHHQFKTHPSWRVFTCCIFFESSRRHLCFITATVLDKEAKESHYKRHSILNLNFWAVQPTLFRRQPLTKWQCKSAGIKTNAHFAISPHPNGFSPPASWLGNPFASLRWSAAAAVGIPASWGFHNVLPCFPSFLPQHGKTGIVALESRADEAITV